MTNPDHMQRAQELPPLPEAKGKIINRRLEGCIFRADGFTRAQMRAYAAEAVAAALSEAQGRAPAASLGREAVAWQVRMDAALSGSFGDWEECSREEYLERERILAGRESACMAGWFDRGDLREDAHGWPVQIRALYDRPITPPAAQVQQSQDDVIEAPCVKCGQLLFCWPQHARDSVCLDCHINHPAAVALGAVREAEEFVSWNRSQKAPPIKIGFEYNEFARFDSWWHQQMPNLVSGEEYSDRLIAKEAWKAALAQAPAHTCRVDHEALIQRGRDLERMECINKGLDAELSQAPAVRVTGLHRYEESGHGWCKLCGYAAHVAEQHGAALGQGKASG